jgi:DNA-binding beta-propeller fold protein YncE
MNQVIRNSLKVLLTVAGLSLLVGAQAQLHAAEFRSSRLAFDPSREIIYATVPSTVPKIGNTLTILDPMTLAQGASLFVGSEPQDIEITDSINVAYVVLSGSMQIAQVDLAAWGIIRTFGMGSTGFNNISDIAAQPQSESVIAVSEGDDIAVFSNGLPLPTRVNSAGNLLAFSDDPSLLYAFDGNSSSVSFYRLLVNENGVSEIDHIDDIVEAFFDIMTFSGGRLFLSSGHVVDPDQREVLGTFPLIGPVIPIIDAGRVLFITRQAGVTTISACDLETYALIEQRQLPEVQGNVLSFVRWGDSGLAFCTDAGWTYSYRSSIVWNPQISNCQAINVIRGIVISGGLASLHVNDNARMILRPGIVFSNQQPPVEIEFTSVAPGLGPDSFGFAFETQTSTVGVLQTLYFYNYATQQFDQVDARNATTSDTRITIDRIGNAANYVNPTTGQVRAKVAFRQVAPVFAPPWEARIDVARWLFPSE